MTAPECDGVCRDASVGASQAPDPIHTVATSRASAIRGPEGFDGVRRPCACVSHPYQGVSAHRCGCRESGDGHPVRHISCARDVVGAQGLSILSGYPSENRRLSSEARRWQCSAECCCCVDSILGVEKEKPSVKLIPVPDDKGRLGVRNRVVGWYRVEIKLSSYVSQEFKECSFELLQAAPTAGKQHKQPPGTIIPRTEKSEPDWEDFMKTHPNDGGVTQNVTKYLKRTEKCPINTTISINDRPNGEPKDFTWLDPYYGLFVFLHRVKVRSGEGCDKCKFKECELEFRVEFRGGTGSATSIHITDTPPKCQ